MLGIFKYGVKVKGDVKVLRSKDGEIVIVPDGESNYISITELTQPTVAAFYKHNKKAKKTKKA